ncbi:MAG: hypothetical protein GY778_06460 [bacterium]|nr:hypothetical protein [bacterium]
MNSDDNRSRWMAFWLVSAGVTLAGCGLGAPPSGGDAEPTGGAASDADAPDDDVEPSSVTAEPPAPRGGAPAVWMPESETMVLFGGMNPITDDTYAFDARESLWRRLRPEDAGSVPEARCHHTFVAIPGEEAGLLFGGFSFGGRFNDVWKYDGRLQEWSQLDPDGAMPAERCLHTAAFIESRNQMLVYGGIQGGGTRSGDFFDDTHILDLAANRWTRLESSGPGKLEGAVAFYVAAEDAVYLWGGKQVDTFPTTLWRFDVAAGEWGPIETGGDVPMGREDPIIFWDEAGQALTIFSGRNDSRPEVLLDDGYRLDLTDRSWRRLTVTPVPRSRWRASTVVDPATSSGLMFGGWLDFGGVDALDDTWSYDVTAEQWRRIAETDR